jgi:L-lactate dehydrogenase
MYERLFTEHADARNPLTTIRPRKAVIIGAGQVGLACAYSMLIQDTIDELVLQDIDTDKVEGEVMDLVHGLPFVQPSSVKAGSVADHGRDADVVVITAGAKQRPGENRLALMERNVEIFKSIIGDIVTHCPNTILLIASNPVDVMTYISLRLSGFPPTRVIGSGTVLDTARFRYHLAEHLKLDPRSIHAYIIGEHGDSEVPVWSKVNVAGTMFCDAEWRGSPASDDAALNAIFEQVKNAAYEIIRRKGYTSYAIGLGITEIVRAILRSQKRVMTVSSLIDGLYGIEDVCLSLPAVVDRLGATRIVNLPLSPLEEEQLRHSATVLREAIEPLGL